MREIVRFKINARVLFLAAVSGFLWVAFGAATGHEVLAEPFTRYLEKAQRYHVVHTLVLLFLSLQEIDIWHWLMVSLFVLGMVFFCGALYLMAIYALALNILVPIGGVCFLLGWAVLAVQAVKIGRN